MLYGTQYFVLKPPGEEETDGKGVTIRFATLGEAGRIELIAAGVEGMNDACEQAYTKGDKSGAKSL